MLAFLPKLAALLLSSGGVLLSHLTAAMLIAADQTRIAPRDPSTLDLAIVGFVTLTVYLAATGWRLSRREENRARPPSLNASMADHSTDRSESPKRGAA